MRLNGLVAVCFSVGALIIGNDLGATTLSSPTTVELFERAELLVQAVVVGVEYRNSDMDRNHPLSLPHTFVTLQIERAHKGSAQSGNLITLRFQGGPDGAGNVLLIPGVPLFDVGDRDVLFIRGNGTELVPLVGWQQGRFRIVNDLVYSDEGEEVWLTDSGELVLGEPQPLVEVTTHDLGGSTLQLNAQVGVQRRELPAGARRMSAGRFTKFIEDAVRRLGHQAAKVQLAQPSVDIRDQFFVEGLPGAAPPTPSR